MIINVKVKPGFKIAKIEKIGENDFIVCVKAQAREGKANLELIKMFSKYFNVSYKQIIIKNPSSRKKILEITTL